MMDPDIYYIALVCALPLLGYFGPKWVNQLRKPRTMQPQPRQTGRVFRADDPPPQPTTIELGPNLKAVLLAIIALIGTVLGTGYVNHKAIKATEAEAKEAKSEASKALEQGEKNGAKLKKASDEKLEAENSHRKMIGMPPLRGEE